MSTLKLTMSSTSVDGDFGIVDIFLNNATLAENLELNADLTELEYTVDFNSGENQLKINLLNDKATDLNGDGTYEETMIVTISSVAISVDDQNFQTIVPRPEETDEDENGNVNVVSEGLSSIEIVGLNSIFEFTVK